MKLSEHFDDSEFACKGCGELPKLGVAPGFVAALERLRAALGGHPIVVTSGYRCEKHNSEVGGAPRSFHMSDPLVAADIQVRGRSVDEVADAATLVGFSGIGIYERHVHVDMRAELGFAPWREDKRERK